LSASISCSEALAAIRGGERLPPELIRSLGEDHPTDFFPIIVESLADSFDPTQAAAYEEIMRVWIPSQPPLTAVVPSPVETVYVLSRVTLGADIKITSIILDAMKRRFPDASIILVAGRKSIDLFETDARIWHIEADYPRRGSVSHRLKFAQELRNRLDAPNCIVIDPDSRMTQLGLIPLCEPEHYFHFPSRTADSADNLTDLTQSWLEKTFGQSGKAHIAPRRIDLDDDRPRAAISFGVGENESKRISSNFESQVIRKLADKFRTLWIDRGVGGEEARRVTAAAEASGAMEHIRFWEGSFAGFASIISQCDLYVGYDSAGQHAAAAAGVPLISIFKGAPSDRFRRRWSPSGSGRIDVMNADALSAQQCLEQIRALLNYPSP